MSNIPFSVGTMHVVPKGNDACHVTKGCTLLRHHGGECTALTEFERYINKSRRHFDTPFPSSIHGGLCADLKRKMADPDWRRSNVEDWMPYADIADPECPIEEQDPDE